MGICFYSFPLQRKVCYGEFGHAPFEQSHCGIMSVTKMLRFSEVKSVLDFKTKTKQIQENPKQT